MIGLGEIGKLEVVSEESELIHRHDRDLVPYRARPSSHDHGDPGTIWAPRRDIQYRCAAASETPI